MGTVMIKSKAFAYSTWFFKESVAILFLLALTTTLLRIRIFAEGVLAMFLVIVICFEFVSSCHFFNFNLKF